MIDLSKSDSELWLEAAADAIRMRNELAAEVRELEATIKKLKRRINALFGSENWFRKCAENGAKWPRKMKPTEEAQ